MRIGLAMLFVSLLAMAGCGGEERCGDGGPCGAGETCLEAAACGEARCVVPCNDDWTCGGDAVCDWTHCDGEVPVCVAPGEVSCSYFGCGACEVCGAADRCEPKRCAAGLVCDIASSECEPTCERDDECPPDERCVMVLGVNRCWKREIRECIWHDECYIGGGYCGDTGDGLHCVPMGCGSEFNSCAACAEGPEWVGLGPVIFAGSQTTTCSPSAACPREAPVACQWRFAMINPGAKVQEPLPEYVRLWGGATGPGGHALDGVVRAMGSDGLWRIAFASCHPDDGPISFAVSYVEPPGFPSNALCMTGSSN